MKVCMLTLGVFNYTVALAAALAKHCRVDAWFSDYHLRKEDPAVLDALKGACRVVRFGSHRNRDPRSVLSAARACRGIRAENYDLIHVQEYPNLWMSMWWPLVGETPVVATIHDPLQHPGLPFLTRAYQDFVQKISVQRARKYIVLGQSLKDQLLQRYPKIRPTDVHIILHGDNTLDGAWDSESRDEKPADAPKTILFFGEVRPNKGLEYLLQAEEIMNGRMKNYEIVIAGRCDNFAGYQKYVRTNAPIFIRSDFIPNSEVPALFRGADVVVLPYTSATQSGIIPMAYAFGKPVIASRVGALPDVVADGQTGLLVEPRNPQQLAAAIMHILSDDDLRARMGRHGRMFGRNMLDWDSIAGNTMEVYESAVQTGGAAARKRSTS